MPQCSLKGLLSFIILWFLRNGSLTGAEIAESICSLKGRRPSPGTIYPALRELNSAGFIRFEKRGREKRYYLTGPGKKELRKKLGVVKKIFLPICRSKL